MLDQESGGAIVIISSVAAMDGGLPKVSYLTSEDGVLGLNAHIGHHYCERGIRCNCICPGVLEQTPNTIHILIRTIALRDWRHLLRCAASQRLMISLRGAPF